MHTLDPVLQHPAVWKGQSMASAIKSLSTEFVALDELLPGGGWQQGAVTELLLENEGIGELRLLIPALGSITHAGGWVALIATPYVPYAPALARLGINLNQLIVLEARALKDQWWAAEQALRAGSCEAVVFWPKIIDDRNLRRLQLAAQTGGSIGFVFTSAARAAHPSPAPLRIKLAAAAHGLQVNIIKRRGSLVEAPLLIDVGMEDSFRPPVTDASARKLYPDIRPRTRTVSPKPIFPTTTKHYPNGIDSKKIWDQVLARGDTVKRSSSEDRR